MCVPAYFVVVVVVPMLLCIMSHSVADTCLSLSKKDGEADPRQEGQTGPVGPEYLKQFENLNKFPTDLLDLRT